MSIARVQKVRGSGVVTLLVAAILSIAASTGFAAGGIINPYYTVNPVTLSNGTVVDEGIINGPPTPPPGFEAQRQAAQLPEPNTAGAYVLADVPGFSWVFGCSAVSGAMIAGYYDRNGYSNMYTGPANGGIVPLNNSTTYWPTWSDGSTTYPNCPLIASHQGVDGRATKGSIDDYWVQYNSTANDPYITGSWTQHTWAESIGDYMKTSQSGYSNTDGSSTFYNWTSLATPLTCDDMVANSLVRDATLGRKQFYEARGYTVTTCYNQKTDNNVTGGFSYAQFKAEINAGRPVMVNLEGHTVVGVGYDDAGSLIYIHDTWDYTNHTMTWGGSYSGMALQSVSIVNLAAAPTPTGSKKNDLNGDAKSDIIWRNTSTGMVTAWLMNGTTQSGSGTLIGAGNTAWTVAGTGDFNGDSKADILWRNTSTGQVTMWLMNGTTQSSWASILGAGNTAWTVAGTGDFNGDGKSDILWRNTSTGQVTMWLMNGTTQSSAATILAAGNSVWTVAGTGDFNGDGKFDILWRNSSSGQLVMWMMNGTSQSSYGVVWVGGDTNWTVAGTGDFNGDGKFDILWRNTSTGQVTMWLMNGATQSGSGSVLAAGNSVWTVGATGDYNGDGKYDILWRNTSTGMVTIWLMNGTVASSSGIVWAGGDANWTVVGN